MPGSISSDRPKAVSSGPVGQLLDAQENLLVGGREEILRYGPASQAAFTVSLRSPVHCRSPSITPPPTARPSPAATTPRPPARSPSPPARRPGRSSSRPSTTQPIEAQRDVHRQPVESRPAASSPTARASARSSTTTPATKFYVVNDGSPRPHLRVRRAPARPSRTTP